MTLPLTSGYSPDMPKEPLLKPDDSSSAPNPFDALTPDECQQLEAAANEAVENGELDYTPPENASEGASASAEGPQPEDTTYPDGEGEEIPPPSASDAGMVPDIQQFAEHCNTLAAAARDAADRADAAVDSAKENDDGDPKKAAKAAKEADKAAADAEKIAEQCSKAVEKEDWEGAAQAAEDMKEAVAEAMSAADEAESYVGTAAPMAPPPAGKGASTAPSTPAGGSAPSKSKPAPKGGPMGAWAARAMRPG